MSIQDIRNDSEARMAAAMEQLHAKHRRQIERAIVQHGSISAIPLDFWRRIMQDLEDHAAELLLAVVLATSQVAANAIRVDIGEESTRRIAQDFARQRAREVAAEYTANTRDKLQRQFEQPVESLEDMRGRIDGVLTPERAERLSVTETTEGISAGQSGTADEAETQDPDLRVVRVWRTEQDVGVCPVCAPLDNVPGDVWGRQFPTGPPAHVNCLLPGTDVLPRGLIAASRLRYDGLAIRVVTAKGRNLCVTANHQILTPRGFVAAQRIAVGDDVICNGVKVDEAFVDPDDYDVPTPVEKIFGAIRESASVLRSSVPSTPEQLHGDGQSVDGDIEVVSTDRLLGRAGSAMFDQELHKFPVCALRSSISLTGLCRLDAVLVGLSLAAHGIMSGRNKCQALLGGHARLPDDHSSATATLLETHRMHSGYEGFSADTETLGSLLDGFPGIVSTDQVIDIDSFAFHGYSYDLQTFSGVYNASGLLTSNCRCELLLKPQYGTTHRIRPAFTRGEAA